MVSLKIIYRISSVILRDVKKFLLVILILFSRNAAAQRHYNAWFRASFNYNLSKKLTSVLEMQYRKQNGLGNANFCDKELMYSARLWFNYQHSNQILYAISPITVFKHSRIIQLQEDELATPVRELRMTAMLKAQTTLKSKLFFVTSTKAEYRIFDNTSKDILRMRQLAGLTYQINEKMEVFASDEIFLNATGASALHIFDQNRMLFQFSFSPKPQWKFEVGFVHINRILSTSVDILDDENIFINLNYTLQ
jgi:hypothetical protein